MKKNKKSILIVLSIIILFLSVNIYSYKNNKSTSPNVVTINNLKQQKISKSILIPGSLKLKEEQKVYSNSNNEINKFNVKEGDRVKKGDILLNYKTDKFNLELQKNEIEIRSINLKLQQLNKKLNKLNIDLSKKYNDTKLLNRKSELLIEIEMFSNDFQSKKLFSEELVENINDSVEYSKIDGYIERVNKNGKDGSLLIHVVNPSQMLAKGSLSEYDVVKVEKGQDVIITSDIFPNDSWKGKVEEVGYLPKNSSVATGENSKYSYQITSSIKGKLNNLKPGFRLLLEIKQKSNMVNALPVKSVTMKKGTPHVYVVKNKKLVKKNVITGDTDGKYIEVLSGVSNKDSIVVSSQRKMEEGMVVKIK